MTPNAAELGERVLLPLVAGGDLRPLPPIGPARARDIARAESAMPSGGSLDLVRAHRLRASRRLASLDALGDLGPGEWLLACALNDLLQVPNPSLVTWLDKDRPLALLGLVRELVVEAGPPATVAEALARHATFARVFALRRVDTTVMWWVGSETFVGKKPPPRLLRWRGVRRVRTQENPIPLAAMAPSSFEGQGFESVLAAWLARTPLTDLANAHREQPVFQWTGSTLCLVSSALGQNVARRAVLRSSDANAAVAAITRATAALGDHPSSAVAAAFLGALG